MTNSSHKSFIVVSIYKLFKFVILLKISLKNIKAKQKCLCYKI